MLFKDALTNESAGHVGEGQVGDGILHIVQPAVHLLQYQDVVGYQKQEERTKICSVRETSFPKG